MTIKEFDEIPFGEVFATGLLRNSPHELYMTDSKLGEMLRWVAKKGYGYDWAIYCHWDFHSVDWVTRQGDKVMGEKHIKLCVPCDDEVFKRYRK